MAHVPGDRRIAADVAEAMRTLPDLELAAVTRHGTASVVRGEIGRIRRASREDVPGAAQWRDSLDRLAGAFRVKLSDLEPGRRWTDELGTTHIRYAQRKHGLPVVGVALSLHADGDGRVYAAFGNVRDDDAAPRPSSARVTRREAFATALAQEGVQEADSASLVYVITSDTQELCLAWMVAAMGARESMPLDADLFIDAITGRVIDEHLHVHGAMFRAVYKSATGSPTDSDPNTPGLQYPADYPRVLYKDEDGNRSPWIPSGPYTPAAYYWDLTTPHLTPVADANWQALKYAYDLLSDEHQRDSFDAVGGRLVSEVNGPSPNNAYWDGTLRKMVFGTGDGVNFSAFGSDLDVVAHELTHGVTQFTSQLIYRFESGALNESFSDIMATAAQWKLDGKRTNTQVARDHNIWKMGEAYMTPGTAGDASRYLYDPQLDYGRYPSFPEGYSRDFYAHRYTGTEDAGGVHFNSGIPNLAFYLLAMGGQHPRGKSAVTVPYTTNIADAEKIFYRAFTTYLGPGAQMIDARYATIQAAASLFGTGSAQWAATQLAWDAVGVPALQNNTHPVNLSTRSYVGTGNNIMIAGFVLSGSGSEPCLLRGVGPTLSSFGVTGTLVDPEIRLYTGSTLLASNDNWGNATTQPSLVSTANAVGAYQLLNDSADAAMLPTLGAGVYSVQLNGKNSGVGNGMVEVYDTALGSSLVMKNLSTRCMTRPGEPAIAGVVVQGQAHKWLLVRAAGPALGALGVPGVHPDPKVTIFSGSTAIYTNDDWYSVSQTGNPTYDSEIPAVVTSVGAFPFARPSKDAALLVSLPPGIYTVQAGVASGSSSGLVLLEVYDVSEMR